MGNNVYTVLPSVFIKKGKNMHVCVGLYTPSLYRPVNRAGWVPGGEGGGQEEREPTGRATRTPFSMF